MFGRNHPCSRSARTTPFSCSSHWRSCSKCDIDPTRHCHGCHMDRAAVIDPRPSARGLFSAGGADRSVEGCGGPQRIPSTSRANPSVMGLHATITYPRASTIEGKTLATPSRRTGSPWGTTIGSARPPPKTPAGTIPTTRRTGCRYDYNGVAEFRLFMLLVRLARVVERTLRSKSWHRHLLHLLSTLTQRPQLSVPGRADPVGARKVPG